MDGLKGVDEAFHWLKAAQWKGNVGHGEFVKYGLAGSSWIVKAQDDPIRKDHDWELFDRLSLRKRQNRDKRTLNEIIW
ncbi:Ycf2, chloroplast [Artemisia annua]|uniref:Ycf2, chloroplast n=1 Tax=Artemisia annua TaxID=35608 RepID=A0A2U1Q378_ARTAN|nr:Ycf2, chloroplast [Artemisia annua]